MLRKTFWTKRFWIWSHSNFGINWWRTISSIVSIPIPIFKKKQKTYFKYIHYFRCSDGKAFTGPKAAAGSGCLRCGFPVYAAEQMISKDRIWHKRCFSCVECRKSLDSTNLNDGPDGEIYCRACYGRNFGPKGVGFGIGAGTLTMV